MMFGTKDEFTYLECSSCGCLQLLDAPPDMKKYYPADYYSFDGSQDAVAPTPSLKDFLRKLRNRAYLADSTLATNVLDRVTRYEQFRAFAAAKPTRESRILDVGCGAGHLLKDVVSLGFKHTLGIDPFVAADIKSRSGLEVRKCSLDDLAGTKWDLVMFHHSFEHVPEPLATLQMVTNLLFERGCCLIRVPVVAWAWQTYGVHWVELEAPRHYFLHTERSLGVLAQRAGLRVTRVDYDSDGFELWGSELYRRGIPLSKVEKIGDPREFFSTAEMKQFRKTARRLNARREGGRAAFYLSRL